MHIGHHGTRLTGAMAAAESLGQSSGVDDRELLSVSELLDPEPSSEVKVDVREMVVAGARLSWTASSVSC